MKKIQFEIDTAHIRKRIWQIIPGTLSWGTLIGLSVLAFVLPFWIAIFVIMYDVYILIRIAYMSVHLIFAYRRLNQLEDVDWIEKCKKTNYDIKWDNVNHVVVFPTYDESLTVLRASLNAVANADFPKENMHIVVGFEERAGEEAKEKKRILTEEFKDAFGTFLTTHHPDGLPGEKRVKSANATWAIKKMDEIIKEKGIHEDNVIVSNFDSDTVVTPKYFSYLTYEFLRHEDRYHASYQPIPVYNNNLWDAPSFSRVIAMGSTFWQLIESNRPERLVTFSSHSMTLKALHDVGFWDTSAISEDSRIFWQCLLKYDGQYKTQPLYIKVSMDAALAQSWWQTLKNQYKQKRRWAWGIENFPYVMEGFRQNKNMPLKTKILFIFRTLEGHYSWATAPIIVAGLGWLPVIFGDPLFHTTFISYSLPFMTRTLMTVAMSGLIISAVLTFMIMPRRPVHYKPWRYALFILQWVLVPAIATLLSAFPAIDAETRLLLGRDLQFNVMQKTRKKHV